MKLVRVRRKDGSSYLAEVLENPRTTHDHPHKHWMIVKGKGMIQFEHKHRHVHVKGSLKFHAHKHTSAQMKGMFRSANVSKNASSERTYPEKTLREGVAGVRSRTACPACKAGRHHTDEERRKYHPEAASSEVMEF